MDFVILCFTFCPKFRDIGETLLMAMVLAPLASSMEIQAKSADYARYVMLVMGMVIMRVMVVMVVMVMVMVVLNVSTKKLKITITTKLLPGLLGCNR